ncbi:MAG: acetyl-CoA carboxylase biotin carboxyl carrier protein subunit [Deltaproteobacteria bacterium]|nr:MAG: acetyl-CoA carboxylase biotin carboxyl carrier protein subunit [Deltaproteobacteria bacterium]
MAETLIVRVADKEFTVQVESFDGGRALLEVAGQRYTVSVQKEATPLAAAAGDPGTTADTSSPAPVVSPPVSRPPTASGSGKIFTAQMPGTVLRLVVEAGQQVSSGDILLVIEAMKMENEIRSDRSGQIAEIMVKPGQQVQTGDGLVSFR